MSADQKAEVLWKHIDLITDTTRKGSVITQDWGIRVLAVLSDKRSAAAPDAPAVTQLGYPAVTPGLNGLYAPAGLPRPLVEQLQGICQKVVEGEGFGKAAQGMQQTPVYLNAPQFKARIERTYKTNADLVPDLKLEKS